MPTQAHYEDPAPAANDAAPTLVSDGRRLFLALKGPGNGSLNVLFSPDDGAIFVGKMTSPEGSSDGPALASHGSQIVIAWRSGDEQLNVAQVATC